MEDREDSAAGTWTDICHVDDVFEGSGRRYQVPGFPPLAVFNIGGAFHVTDDTCTHGDASLADGWVHGDEVECPFHSGRFRVSDGEATAFPCTIPLRVYRAKVEDGRVLVSPQTLPPPG
jgi:nitrite reductase/ring-hydroxylating ferredoxin subunit